MATSPKYEVLGAKSSNPNWTGTPTTLAVDDSVAMPQTPNGSMVFAYENKSDGNNDGMLVITSGGSDPVDLDSPAGLKQPKILVKNWGANNIKITNVSANQDTPIWVEAAGPGLSPKPSTLPIGTAVKLDTYTAAQGTTKPSYMQLKLTSNTGDLTVVAVTGGPADASGNNASVYALNWPGGPPPADLGYTKVTGGNSLTTQFNWGASVIWVANMSPSTATAVTVILRAL